MSEPRPILSRRSFLGGIAAAMAVAALPIPTDAPVSIAHVGTALKAGDTFTIAGAWDVMWGAQELQVFKVIAHG